MMQCQSNNALALEQHTISGDRQFVVQIRVYFRRGGTPLSNEVSAKMVKVGPLKYTLAQIPQRRCVAFRKMLYV